MLMNPEKNTLASKSSLQPLIRKSFKVFLSYECNLRPLYMRHI